MSEIQRVVWRKVLAEGLLRFEEGKAWVDYTEADSYLAETFQEGQFVRFVEDLVDTVGGQRLRRWYLEAV